MPRPVRTQELEAAYRNGFRGVFLPSDSDDGGRAARHYRDKFRELCGNNANFAQHHSDLRLLGDTKTGYVASVDAFRTYQRDRDTSKPDWLFKCVQNSGICVGSSGVEMFHGILGTRAADPANREVFKLLMAQWAYMFRGSCGQGWYMGAHASVTMQYGYCFADIYEIPGLGLIDYDGEDDSEKYVTSTWCRRQPDEFIELVRDNGWRFEDGAIFEFSGSVDELRRVIRDKAQIHHGSNYTANGIDDVRRIGGHAQTMFGGRWDPMTLRFYNDLGIRFTEENFPCANHQTWGRWSGECPDDKWCYGHDGTRPFSWAEVQRMPADERESLTQLFGPKPEGAWIMGAEKQVRYFTDGYVYRPLLKGIPGSAPPPPQPPSITHPEISGVISVDKYDGRDVIRGLPVVHIPANQQPGEYKYAIRPEGDKFKFEPFVL